MQKYIQIHILPNGIQICYITYNRNLPNLLLQEHISSVHAGEALYKCNFCPKTFNVRSNYYTHRRRMHPDEHQKILDKREADRVIMNNDNDMTTIKYKCHICDIEYQFKQKLKVCFTYLCSAKVR